VSVSNSTATGGSAGFAAIVNAAAVLNINNCTVTGNTNGIQVNSGAHGAREQHADRQQQQQRPVERRHLVHRVAAGQLADRQPDERRVHVDRHQAVETRTFLIQLEQSA
jgi:hypothetical protein